MSHRFAIWLLPGEPGRSALRSTVRQLAARHAVAAFEPHVTVFAGRRGPSEAVGWLLAGAAADLRPVTLRGGRYGESAEFFKTAFIEFESDPALESIARSVGSGLQDPQAYELRPHLSLIYKTLAEPGRRAILASLPPAPEALRCDELVVASPGATDDWRDVAGWRIEERVRLGAAAQ